jgi:Putative beta-barrel porin-2, OmpL-like. bbp2
MLQKILMACTATIVSIFTYAQQAVVPVAEGATTEKAPAEEEKAPALKISGSADVYYRYDFAKTKANNLTSFTNTQNAFSLGMASIKAEHQGGKVGVVLDLGFGTRATEFAYNDKDIAAAVKQLYVTYAPADWIKFTAGSWATHVGYELVDPQLNRNYSMSYMFTNGPFTHTGLKADITKGKHGFMLGVSNATDYRTVPGGKINKKFVIAQYSVAPSEDVKIYFNYVGGKNPDTSITNQFDIVATAKLSEKFSAGINGTVNSGKAWDGAKNISGKSWGGAAVYLNMDPKSWLGFTLREEYFSDKNQLRMFAFAPKGGNIFATTVSANFKVNSFLIIPELRLDNASETIFIDKSGAAKKSFTSFLVAAVYAF